MSPSLPCLGSPLATSNCSPHHPTPDSFPFFKWTGFPSSSRLLFPLFHFISLKLFLPSLVFLAHSSAHLLFRCRHHLLLEASPDSLHPSWVRQLSCLPSPQDLPLHSLDHVPCCVCLPVGRAPACLSSPQNPQEAVHIYRMNRASCLSWFRAASGIPPAGPIPCRLAPAVRTRI